MNTACLQHDYVSSDELTAQSASWWRTVLGVVGFERPPQLDLAQVPVTASMTPSLGDTDNLCEVWRVVGGQDVELSAGSLRQGRVHYRYCDELLFGSITVDEAMLDGNGRNSSAALLRATTTASMDTPGPFEKVSTQAYFNVTVPGPPDTPQQTEQLMAQFNRGTILSTAIHEAYPGHYVQFLWVPQAPSKVRKLLGASSNAEGWAHYCEQMMLDEGYGQPGTGAQDARDARMIRLGQLQDALLRDARYIAGIQMHTGQMTFEQAVRFFVDEGYETHAGALVETKRGTTDATYLYYTLGKLQILKLREDLEKKEGAQFSLRQFHDDFLKQGFPPIKIVRRALLGDTSPTL